ncbi:MAG: DUF58 domain-containing protein [Acidimicrobiia bacterium]
MPTGRGWSAIGVSASLFVLWAAFGENDLMTTAVFLIAAVLVGLLFVRMVTPEVAVWRRITPAQVHEGDTVIIDMDLIAARRLRNVSLEDTVHGLGTARFAAGSARPREPLTGRYEVRCRGRGIFPVGPLVLSVSDPFSLAERRSSIGEVDRLTVYPRIEALVGLPVVRGLDPTVNSTRPTSAPFGGEDFFTLREYQVGDDLRKVHWPSSAKRDELMIKQLEVPWQNRALVLLDTRSHRYPIPEAFEQAVRGAASAFVHLHRAGFSPELWSGVRTRSRSLNRYAEAMETLATIHAGDRLDLRNTVSRLLRHGGGGGALVLVTGTPDEGLRGAHRLLAGQFSQTIVMAVTDDPDTASSRLLGMNAVTVTIGTQGRWAPSWRAAMEVTWATA